MSQKQEEVLSARIIEGCVIKGLELASVGRMVYKLHAKEKAIEIINRESQENTKWIVAGYDSPVLVRADFLAVPEEIRERLDDLHPALKYNIVNALLGGDKDTLEEIMQNLFQEEKEEQPKQ